MAELIRYSLNDVDTDANGIRSFTNIGTGGFSYNGIAESGQPWQSNGVDSYIPIPVSDGQYLTYFDGDSAAHTSLLIGTDTASMTSYRIGTVNGEGVLFVQKKYGPHFTTNVECTAADRSILDADPEAVVRLWFDDTGTGLSFSKSNIISLWCLCEGKNHFYVFDLVNYNEGSVERVVNGTFDADYEGATLITGFNYTLNCTTTQISERMKIETTAVSAGTGAIVATSTVIFPNTAGKQPYVLRVYIHEASAAPGVVLVMSMTSGQNDNRVDNYAIPLTIGEHWIIVEADNKYLTMYLEGDGAAIGDYVIMDNLSGKGLTAGRAKIVNPNETQWTDVNEQQVGLQKGLFKIDEIGKVYALSDANTIEVGPIGKVDSQEALPSDQPFGIVEPLYVDGAWQIRASGYDGVGSLTVFINKTPQTPVPHTPSGNWVLSNTSYDGAVTATKRGEPIFYDELLTQAIVDSAYAELEVKYPVAGGTYPGSSTFAAGGSISAVASVDVAGASSMGSSGSVAALSSVEASGSASMVASGGISAEADVSWIIEGSSTLQASGSISAEASVESGGSVSMAAGGTVSSSAYAEVAGATSMAASGSMTALSSVDVSGTSSMAASGGISAEADTDTGPTTEPGVIYAAVGTKKAYSVLIRTSKVYSVSIATKG